MVTKNRNIGKKDLVFSRRANGAHKGQTGKVLVIAGSEELVGAATLACMGAYRSGVDLVKLVAPSKVAWAANAYSPSIISEKLPGNSFGKQHVARVLKESKWADAVLIGNGIGRGKEQLAFVKELLAKLDKPVVIDADALHGTDISKIKNKHFVLTPHAGEYDALIRKHQGDEKKIMASLSEDKVVLLKGKVDAILYGQGKAVLNKTGVPEMAVGGTGDILAGLVVGFLAQGLSSKQAAMNAAYLLGKAGEAARKDFGNFVAEELLAFLKF